MPAKPTRQWHVNATKMSQQWEAKWNKWKIISASSAFEDVTKARTRATHEAAHEGQMSNSHWREHQLHQKCMRQKAQVCTVRFVEPCGLLSALGALLQWGWQRWHIVTSLSSHKGCALTSLLDWNGPHTWCLGVYNHAMVSDCPKSTCTCSHWRVAHERLSAVVSIAAQREFIFDSNSVMHPNCFHCHSLVSSHCNECCIPLKWASGHIFLFVIVAVYSHFFEPVLMRGQWKGTVKQWRSSGESPPISMICHQVRCNWALCSSVVWCCQTMFSLFWGFTGIK